MNRFAPCLALALLTACGAGSDQAASPDPVALVTLAPAVTGSTAEETLVYGFVEPGPSGERAIAAPADAIIAALPVAPGTSVRAGQAVVALRPAAIVRIEIAKAASDARLAAASYERAMRLKADGLGSDAEVEAARAALVSARAAGNVGIGANGTVLRAPTSGTLRMLAVKVGDQVTAGTVVATIGKPGDVRARFGVAPADAQRAFLGQKIVIQPASGGKSAETTIIGIDTQLDPTSRQASLFTAIPPAMSATAGEALRGTLRTTGNAVGLTVPYSALLDDGGQPFVFVVNKGVAHRHDVVIGAASNDHITILKGLQRGAMVVTVGGTAVEDGMRVRTK